MLTDSHNQVLKLLFFGVFFFRCHKKSEYEVVVEAVWECQMWTLYNGGKKFSTVAYFSLLNFPKSGYVKSCFFYFGVYLLLVLSHGTQVCTMSISGYYSEDNANGIDPIQLQWHKKSIWTEIREFKEINALIFMYLHTLEWTRHLSRSLVCYTELPATAMHPRRHHVAKQNVVGHRQHAVWESGFYRMTIITFLSSRRPH